MKSVLSLETFFNNLFGNMEEGYIEIRALSLNASPRQNFYTGFTEAIQSVGNVPADFNIYFGVCTRRDKQGTEAAVLQVPGFWADVDAKHYEPRAEPDPKKNPSGFDPEALKRGKAKARKVIDDFEFKPSILVDSGGGLQAYWLLREPLEIATPEDRLKVRGYLIGIQRAVHSDAVHDLSRIMRVPETRNLKYANVLREAPLVSVEDADPDLRYNPMDFDDYREKIVDSKATVNIADIPDEIPSRFFDLLKVNQKLRTTWDGQRPDLKDQSRSGHDMALASQLALHGFSDGEIAAILRQAPSGKGLDATKQYLGLTISKARDTKDQLDMGTTIIKLPDFPMDAVMPPSGFIRDYVTWIAPLTEAPDQFHVGTALATLSTAVGTDAYLPFGHKRISSNVWVILISPAGIFRKTTAQDGGKGLLLDFSQTIPPQNPTSGGSDDSLVFVDQFSPEAFIDGLSEQPTRLLVYSEMGSLLDAFERSYMVGMKSMLTDLYDCPALYRRRLRKQLIWVEKPFVSILGASTIDWLTGKLRSDDLRSGFLSRFVFVSADKRKPPISYPPEQDQSMRNKLLLQLKDCQDAASEMKLSDEALERWDEWYRHSHAELDSHPNVDTLSGFWTRLEIYGLKFGMLLHLSTYGDEIISLESLNRAIALVDYFKATVRHLIAEEFVFGRDQQDRKRVLRIIHSTPGIAHSQLLRNSHLQAFQLQRVVETLGQEESICVTSGQSTSGRSPKLYYPSYR